MEKEQAEISERSLHATQKIKLTAIKTILREGRNKAEKDTGECNALIWKDKGIISNHGAQKEDICSSHGQQEYSYIIP